MINVDPGRDLSVSGDLSLSNNPPLGFWRIDAKAPVSKINLSLPNNITFKPLLNDKF